MARIRTIKPEFFTSEDIVSLSALARLLYIATWCEADKEGRLVWKPKTFKLRYFPGDACDTEALCLELIEAGLVVLYGGGLAYIPAFTDHQHINPRETASTLPEPDASARVGTRRSRVNDAPPRDSDAQGGREGKGKEGNSHASTTTRGHRLPADWQPTPEQLRWARDARPDVDATGEALKFRDFWIAKPGKDGTKLDWDATWRNWIRNSHGASPKPTVNHGANGDPPKRKRLGEGSSTDYGVPGIGRQGGEA